MAAGRPTIADVARVAQVSPSTASVVFSGKASVTDATRARVLEAAASLGYTGPDPRAASLRRGSSGIVGVVFEEHLGAAFRDPITAVMMTIAMVGQRPIKPPTLMNTEISTSGMAMNAMRNRKAMVALFRSCLRPI